MDRYQIDRKRDGYDNSTRDRNVWYSSDDPTCGSELTTFLLVG